MRDVLTWTAATLVVASIGVATWCARLTPPTLEPARATTAEISDVQPALLRVAYETQRASCGVGEVLMIAAHPDPAQSSASVQLTDGSVETHRAGESIGGFRVAAIHHDRVLLVRDGRACTLHIGEAPTAARATRNASVSVL